MAASRVKARAVRMDVRDCKHAPCRSVSSASTSQPSLLVCYRQVWGGRRVPGRCSRLLLGGAVAGIGKNVSGLCLCVCAAVHLGVVMVLVVQGCGQGMCEAIALHIECLGGILCQPASAVRIKFSGRLYLLHRLTYSL
jgi:hypothetical protein